MSLAGVVGVKVGLPKAERPDLGGFALAVGAKPGSDRVVVIDLASDVGEAVGGVRGGGELMGMPDEVDVEGGDEERSGIIAKEFEETLVPAYSGAVGWRCR